jgi:phosphoribosylglycinamide formyltransferase-1
MQPLRIGVLGSGSGSNFQALLDAIAAGSLPAKIVLVMSDVPNARILERARLAGIPTSLIDCSGHTKKFPLDSQQAVADAMMAAGAELICLAGFMRLIKTPLLHAFPQRVINIHPSVLPAFPGLEAWKQALDAGVTETGCTVHYVDSGMDTGPIIQQAKVPVYANDTYASLHARIQEQEHLIYPSAILKIIPILSR